MASESSSRISRDSASAFGGPDDEFGGIGSNGAQQMEAGNETQRRLTMKLLRIHIAR
jgi:hypothetical protein